MPLLTPRLVPRTAQPQDGFAEIDWSNPITRDLQAIITPSTGQAKKVGTASQSDVYMTPAGLAFTSVGGSASSYWQASPTQYVSGAAQWTIFVLAIPVGGATSRAAYIERPNGTQIIKLGVNLGTVSLVVRDASSNLVSLTGGTNLSGTVATFAGVRVASNSHLVYANGVQEGSSSTNAPGAFNASNVALAQDPQDSADFWPSGVILALPFRRALSADEIKSLHDNPWQVLAPLRIWVPVASAGGTTHTATGSLSADAATLSGAASRVGNHSSSGSLAASAATIAGAANRFAVHASTGALAAGSATIAGTANRFAVHPSSGALAAGAAAIAGTASRTRVHTAVAALIADAATIAGSASRSAPVGGSHTASGNLAADAAVIAGSASRLGNHAATGALVAGSAAISGAAAHMLLHSSTGALVAGSAVIAGAASRAGAAVTHTATGALVCGPAQISGGNGGGAADYSSKPKRKFTVRHGGKLMVFSNAGKALEALNALEVDPEQPQPKKQAEKIKQAVEQLVATQQPEQTVDIEAIREQASAFREQAKFNAMLQQKNYEAAVALYRDLLQRQDDEDIEILLMAL